ncbi:hypothetical protein Mal64_35370 [Pseudobythopirellula maris]|uniref:Lipoprotein n=1 Tax=Pseudobythopirellula maris TaxID=2527991 RepID=A0A5C5ZHQ5_9BACT|nr:hypothetical protein [Pseudobythopirellula maris]TWT86708.1 hypothetical protein Mal64_35370 [Pseudobythopirellula maris]
MKALCRFAQLAVASGFCVAVSGLVGCDSSQNGGKSAAPSADESHADHPTEGPHHGSLIELGAEEYHAELVHDDAAATVTVYLLDSEAKVAVPIDAKEIQINLSHDGQAEQFQLTASPDATDPAGKSSRFASTDAELAAELDHEGSAQLVVNIDGKQFHGAIVHDDDHEGHGE